MAKDSETMVNVRVPEGLLHGIEIAVRNRPLPTSRHAWIMEALHRQIRAELVEGRLEVSTESDLGPQYEVSFLPYLNTRYGGPRPKIGFVGRDALNKYLCK